jgi:hypothetical protein
MKWSDTRAELSKALSAAQHAMTHATKASVNPHFRSRYADLASVIDASRQALADAGLAVTQHTIPLYQSELGIICELETVVSHASGEWCSARVSCVVPDGRAQTVGSAITYLRRYGWSSMLGIAADDDDGAAASRPAPPPPEPTIEQRLEGAKKRILERWPDSAEEIAVAEQSATGEALLVLFRGIYKAKEKA